LNVLTTDNLLHTLRKLGISVDQNRPVERSVKLASSKGSSDGPEEDTIHKAFLGQLSWEEWTQEINSDPEVLKEAFQVLKKRQWLPPKGGYPYAKNDHVTTKTGQLPPSPCKVCGSNNHWDKECPDWSFYEAKQQKTAYWIKTGKEDDLEGYYSSVYLILVMEHMISENKQGSQLDFHEAVLWDEDISLSRECKSIECTPWKKQTVFMEEEEDESWWEYNFKEKSTTCLMYEIGHKDDEPLKRETYPIHNHKPSRCEEMSESSSKNKKTVQEDTPTPSSRPKEVKDPLWEAANNDASIQPAPPTKEKLFRLPKARSHLEGMSAIGVSVLSTKGYVGGLNNLETDLQLDSCADITLISHEFYEQLMSKPSIKQGMRMHLWQLTDKDSQLKGFVRIPIYMTMVEGDILETEAEVYVVPDMTVPILLGEDYQQSYELGVTHNVEEGTHIFFGQHEHRIRAVLVKRTKDFGHLRQSVYLVGQYMRHQFHWRNKGKKHHHKVKFGIDEKTVRAAADYLLKPHESKPIKVKGQLGEDREWLVQKNLLANANDTFFVVPNMLITAAHPWVPIANPMDHPRYIRKGEIIGALADPNTFFDSTM